MKVGVYVRVSCADQSCQIQLDELRRYAAARGVEIYQEYVDEGVSGSKSSRPARNRLMEDARLGKFQEVLVWRLDRWGRSVADTIDTLRLLATYKVNWLAVQQNLGTDESNPMGRFMLTVMSAFAELERELIVERVVAGVRQAQAKGKHCGRPKRVFRRDEAARLRSEGKSWSAISRLLGVPAGTVREGLRKPPAEPVAETAAIQGV